MVARSGDFSGIERLGDVHPTFAVVGSLDDDLKAVCKAATEVERLRKARIVCDRHGIGYLRVRRGVDRKVVVKEIFIQPRLVRKLQIAARANGSVVYEQAVLVALRGRDTSPQRQGRGIALHLDEQFAHHVVSAVAADRIAQGKQEKLYLGNLSSLRDWGYAKDYVECMWLILQNDKPEDFVIATGVQHSVREFCQLAFHHVGIELDFVGEGENEKGIDRATGKVVVEVSPDFYRPTDVVNLWGDPTKAKKELGWNPMKTSFEELVKIMVDADMAKVAVERAGDEIRMNLAEYLEKGIVK